MKIHKNYSIIFAAVMILSLVLAGSAAAKTADKVNVCHRTGNGSFILINVSSAALPAHLSHGDAAPGGAVPGQIGMELAADCSVLAVPQTEPVQTSPVLPIGVAGKHANKVDVCHRRGNGTFILINISRNALPAHLSHGDGLPNGWVPEQPGKKFAANCSLVEVPQKELIQTLTIFPTGASFLSQSLTVGQVYEIKASGTYIYDAFLNWADAEYYLQYDVIQKGDSDTPPYLLDLCINNCSTNTDWGNYQSTHVYTTQWTGTGDPLSFSIYDIYNADNVGFLTVEIWKINW